MKSLTNKAYAKLNLALQVLNKRDDGFHNINTIFTCINLYDEISINLSEQLSVFCDIDLGIPQEENLVYKAAKLFYDNNLVNTPIDIHIKKQIPFGGGLGGGSSDAACVLIMINEFFNLNLKYNTLHDFACKIGSDVPFFLQFGTAIGLSRGENLKYIDFKLKSHILIINPLIHVSTPFAYKALKRTNLAPPKINFEDYLSKDIEKWKNHFFNDFEDAVFELHPEIKMIKEKLYEFGSIFALMSGSGSTVFGLFETQEKAEYAAKYFENYFTKICLPFD